MAGRHTQYPDYRNEEWLTTTEIALNDEAGLARLARR